mgnify:CR=1 FL=1
MYKKAENRVYAKIAEISILRIAVMAQEPKPGHVNIVSVKTEPLINVTKETENDSEALGGSDLLQNLIGVHTYG